MSPLSSKQRILINPLLTNPTKWLDNVPKKHHNKFIQDGFYNRNELNYNPYMKSLVKVDANSSTTVLPVGNAIRLTADVADGTISNKKSQVTLHPRLNFNRDRSEPSRLISNNRAYIQSIQDNMKIAQSYRPMQMDKLQLPLKFKVDFVENMSDEIETLYKDKIKSLLGNVRIDELGDGVHLIEMEGVSRWEDGVLKINKSLIGLDDDTFVTFKNHPQLSQLIIAYCDYKS